MTLEQGICFSFEHVSFCLFFVYLLLLNISVVLRTTLIPRGGMMTKSTPFIQTLQYQCCTSATTLLQSSCPGRPYVNAQLAWSPLKSPHCLLFWITVTNSSPPHKVGCQERQWIVNKVSNVRQTPTTLTLPHPLLCDWDKLLLLPTHRSFVCEGKELSGHAEAPSTIQVQHQSRVGRYSNMQGVRQQSRFGHPLYLNLSHYHITTPEWKE
jgi:hypothetical protein